MTPTPEQNAKRVIELSEKATPGPWYYAASLSEEETGQIGGVSGDIIREVQVFNTDEFEKESVLDEWREQDLELIATYRTAAPELAKAYLDLETELQQLRLAADGMAKERNELSRSIEEAHHVAMIDWPGSEVPLLSQVESLFSALKEHYNDKIESLRTVADGLRDSLVECRKDSLFIHARNPQFEEPAKRHAQATAALEAYRAAGEGSTSPAPQ